MVKEIMGIKILDTLDEIAHPSHSCSLVVDMQKDFCYPTGYLSKKGADVSMIQSMVPRLKSFIETARNLGILIIFIKNTTLKNYLSDSPAFLLFRTRKGKGEKPEYPMIVLEGTEGHDVIDELKICKNDVVIQKNRASAFVNTNLDLVLRSNSIKTVIVTGVATEGCVETTLRHASCLDYYVVLVDDCVASPQKEFHFASIKNMRTRYPVTSYVELIRIWKGE